MERVKLLYRRIIAQYSTKKFVTYITSNDNSLHTVLVLLIIDNSFIKNLTLTHMNNILVSNESKKLHDIILLLRNMYKKTESTIKFFKESDAKLKSNLKEYSYVSIINFIDNVLLKVLFSYTKDMSYRAVNDSNKDTYKQEILGRLIQLKRSYGISLINMTDVGSINLTTFEQMTIKELFSYYNELVKDMKSVLEQMSMQLKKHTVINSMFNITAKMIIKDIDIKNISSSLESFLMSNEDRDIV